MVTALPTDQRRPALEAMLQPLVQTAESLLAAPPAGLALPEEAGRRKDLTLATFERIAVVFRYGAMYSCCACYCPHSLLSSLMTYCHHNSRIASHEGVPPLH